MSKIKFNNSHSPFFNALKERVDAYFEQNNLNKTGNFKLYSKSLILFPLFLLLYTWIVFFNPGIILSVLFCILLGLVIASIGFNIMHDGAHGSYSSKKWLNALSANTLNLVGGSSYMWKIKHNIIHHSYTNIGGVDDDLDNKPFFRMSPTDPKYAFHKYQHYYWFILYMFSYLSWVFIQDFRKYFTGKISDIKIHKMSTGDHIRFWSMKIGYIFFFIILPTYTLGFIPMFIGYLITSCVCGFTISLVFQLAHVVEAASFPEPDATTHKIETEWAVHQIQTTVDFATKSKIVGWFVGGLNFQVEHHLFPKISHIHYPNINRIVRETCKQFNVPYLENNTLFGAIRSHILLLKQLGNPA